MSKILFSIILEKVFNNTSIKEISENGSGIPQSWTFDFKNQSLQKVFLQEYSTEFWNKLGNSLENEIQIGGMETGAIALVAGVSFSAPHGKLVSGFYVRKSRKKSDLANLIEGELRPNIPVILLDDILNEGATIRKQIQIIEEAGCRVAAIFVCLRFRDMSAYQDILDKGISIISMFELNDFSTVLPVSNHVDAPRILPNTTYKLEYKLTLTKKPNLYIVIPKSAPLLHQGKVFIGVDDGTFYALDTESGDVLWTYKIFLRAGGKRILSSPAAWNDNVLFGAYDGNFYCLHATTGKRNWVFTDADWIGSSPCVDSSRGRVYVGLEFAHPAKKGGVVAIDIASGKVIWSNYAIDGLIHGSPNFSKKFSMVYCGSGDNSFNAFDEETGKIIWSYKTGGKIQYGVLVDEERGFVSFGSIDGGLYVLNAKSGKLIHKFETRFGIYSTPAQKGDRIIVGSLDKVVYCFNVATGKTEWTHETHGRIFSSPIIDKDSVFIGSNDGKVYEFDIITGTMRAMIQFTERIVNKIAIDHDTNGLRMLYIPTHAGELYKLSEI